jgi:hypothetical protein
MKKNNLIIGVAALAILGALAYFAWSKKNVTSTISTEETAFAVRDTAAIDKIFISSKSGKRIKLQRRPEDRRWVINDTFLVAPFQIQHLLETMRNVTLRRPLAKAERATVIKSMATKHQKVEIYLNGQLFKTYYVGDEPIDQIGSYYLLEGSETPYVMYLQGFEGYLSIKYDINPYNWRDKALFTSTPQTLQKISVTYPKKPSESFSIKAMNNSFILENAAQPVDTAKLFSYLSAYSKSFVEGYVSGISPAQKDSLLALSYDAEIVVEDISKERSKHLKLRVNDNLIGVGMLLPAQEFVNIQQQVGERWLVGKSYFYKAKK